MVSKGVLNENSSVVLPGAKRNFLVSPVAVAKEFFPGKYSIRLYTRYDGKDDFEVKEWDVFLFPPISFGVVGAFAIIGVWYGRWRRKKSMSI
jgi:hypothetical protein